MIPISLTKEVNMKGSFSFKPILVALAVVGIILSAFPASTYVVRPGDTLFRIALRFGTTTTSLAVVNGIANPNFIFVGMVLRVPCAGSPPPPPPTNICSFYIVQRGDWLGRIAARFGVTWQS